jgi:hypothetical protein
MLRNLEKEQKNRRKKEKTEKIEIGCQLMKNQLMVLLFWVAVSPAVPQ